MASAAVADSRSAFVARFTTNEQIAHKTMERLAEHFAGEDVGISVTDEGNSRWQVALYFSAPPDRRAVRAAVMAAAGKKAAAMLRFARAGATDWVHESLAGLPPVAAGRFIVHGAHDRARNPSNRIGIEVEAALAFGTGHHGTTCGCLLALDRLCKARNPRRRRPRILDLGTGSGVLAIAAARALHTRVVASDIDAEAVRTTRANARRNRAGALVEVIRAAGLTARRINTRAPFDLVLANILLGPLVRLAAPMKRRVAPGGRVVLSGVTAPQVNAVIAAYRPLTLERRMILDGWATLVFKRGMA